jgi:hypothetical protein
MVSAAAMLARLYEPGGPGAPGGGHRRASTRAPPGGPAPRPRTHQEAAAAEGAALGPGPSGALGRQNRRHRNDWRPSPAPPPRGATITLTWVTPHLSRHHYAPPAIASFRKIDIRPNDSIGLLGRETKLVTRQERIDDFIHEGDSRSIEATVVGWRAPKKLR